MNRPLRNLAASVRQRLMNLARTQGIPFQTLLTRYALERLLYRISQSEASERFLLKGALLFLLWSETPHRATRDLDLLGSGNPAIEPLADLFRQLCLLPVEEDGLVYLAESVQAGAIREDNLYGGVRVTLTALLEEARIPVQVDIGFGDAILPEPVMINFPTLLDFPSPRLRAYQRETVIAEKLHALVLLGLGNSRMKDYYDLYVLGQQFGFAGETLFAAISSTFQRRGTSLPEELPIGLSAVFAEDLQKQTQWSAFLRRQQLRLEDMSLSRVVTFLQTFLTPVLIAAREQKPFERDWNPGVSWEEKTV